MSVHPRDAAVRCPHCGQPVTTDAESPDGTPPPPSGIAAPETDAAAALSLSETVTLDLAATADTDGAEVRSGPAATSANGSASTFANAAERAESGASVRAPGEFFGDYRIVREIARGGMGIVYLAQEPRLRRTVALKVLRAGEGATEEDFSRFLREAEAAASLSHRNIVPIHTLDVEQGRPFFTMDYIDGPSLEKRIAEGTLSLREAVEILEEVALAIHYAHEKGIVHRDIKPANVIIAPDGTPMITDFGLAVNLARDPASQRMTHSGVVMGTIPYIPPEQAAGDVDRVGPASDVYSLGAVLYELITGRPPFQGETQFELLHSVIHRDPPPPRRINPKIPADLQTICLKCLEKPRHRRYRSAGELAEDCRAFLNREMIKARPATVWYRIWRTLSRHRGISLLGAGVVILLLAVLVNGYWLENKTAEADRAKEQAEEATRALAEKEEEVEKLKEKTEELTATLDRGWRTLLYERFRNPDRRRWAVISNEAAFKRGYLALSGPPPAETDDTPPRTVSAALKHSVPGDCRVEMQVYIPRKKGAAVGVLLNGRDLQLGGNFGYLVTVGPPSAPGVRIEKGPVTLASKPDVAFAPDRWQTLSVERSEDEIAVALDEEEILRVHDETALRSDEHARIGFLAVGGFAYLDDVFVSVPGSSQQMLTGLLDMADNLYRQGRRDQLGWAIEMAEQVALEAEEPVLRLRAERRCITAYLRLHNNPRAAARRLGKFIDRLRKTPGGRLHPGEPAYLKGLLALEARDYAAAAEAFDTAAAAAAEAANGRQNGDGTADDRPETGAPPPLEHADRYALLGRLQGVLARIRDGRTAEATRRLTEMQRGNALQRIAETYREDLQAGDIHAVFLAEVDRLLEARELDTVWSFLEALRVLYPESGRDFAARSLILARLYEEDGRWQEARDRFDAARALAPEWEDPAIAYAEALERRDETEQAFAVYREALERYPASATVRMRFAEALLERGRETDISEAARAAEEAVELTSRRNPAALDLLVAARIAGDREELARETLREAIELDPTPEREMLLQRLRPDPVESIAPPSGGGDEAVPDEAEEDAPPPDRDAAPTDAPDAPAETP